MEIAFEKEEIAKPKIKLWIIIGFIVLIIIIGFVVYKIISRNSAISEFKEITISHLNQGLDSISEIYTLNSKANDFTGSAQARASLQKQKELVLDNINKLESTGEIVIYENIESYKCSDGKTYNYHPQSDMCLHIGDGIYNLIRSKEKKAFSVNGSYAITNLASSSMLISFEEFSLNALENMEKSPNTIYPTDLLASLNENIVFGQLLLAILANTSAFDKDIKSKMKIIAEEVRKMPLPSEEAIKNLDINKMKKECSDLIPGYYLKVSSSECKKLALENQKTALAVLQRSKDEENPFILMNNKAYLYSLENCYGSTFIDPSANNQNFEEKAPCMEQLFTNLKTRLAST